jgi:voltage-gated potassium channel
VLLVVDFAGAVTTPDQQYWLDRAMTTIWAVFVLDFAIRFILAPHKPVFLRTNWLAAASLVLPFLRPLRVLGALRATRSLSLIRLLGGANRGMRVLQRLAAGRTVAYVAGLTVLAAILGAVGVLHFDRAAEGATIRSFGDAIWWSTTMVTTINSEKHAVTMEGRIVAVLLRLFAISVFGFITATIASYFVGREVSGRALGESGEDRLAAHLTDLRRENAQVRAELARVQKLLEGLSVDDAARTSGPRPQAARPLDDADRIIGDANGLPG